MATTGTGDQRITNGYSPEIRHAFMSYDGWTLGQTWSTFMDVNALPDSIDFIGTTDGTVFVKNNITKVSFAYGDETFFLTEPNLGNIKDPIIESKIFTDMLMSAPFGLKVDPDKITLETVHEGFESGPFPMVYVNLTNFGDKYSRVIPFLNDGSCLNKNNDLSITMNFTAATGSATGVTYYICLFYTDINLILDLKKKGDPIFSSPYIQKY
jgi:hypothetical protein